MSERSAEQLFIRVREVRPGEVIPGDKIKDGVVKRERWVSADQLFSQDDSGYRDDEMLPRGSSVRLNRTVEGRQSHSSFSRKRVIED